MEDAKEIIKVRLHMMKLPANYKSQWKDPRCPLCYGEEGTTEHYETCPNVSYHSKRMGDKKKKTM